MDLRELTFQNVLDTILKPEGVKVGGYPEEIFTDLSTSEVEQWTCNICYLIVKEGHECFNKHLFCHTCIFAWTLTFGENSEKCPVCRCQQNQTYKPNTQIDRLLGERRVKCPEQGCHFADRLQVFLLHEHGKKAHSNAHVDLESLRPARGSGLRVMPFIGGSATRSERGMTIRQQLLQGRVMIHQMMLLLHMEMQLRQEALASYTRAQDPTVRLQRLDEVVALNEQLNEVGGILSTLLNTPLNRLSSAVRDRPRGGHGSSPPSRSTPSATTATSTLTAASRPQVPGRPPGMSRHLSTTTSAEWDSDDDEDDESDSSSSPAVSTASEPRPVGLGRNPRPSLSTQAGRTPIPGPIQPASAAGTNTSRMAGGEASTGRTDTATRSLSSANSLQTRAVTGQSFEPASSTEPTNRPLVVRPRTPMRTFVRRDSNTAAASNTERTTVHHLGVASTSASTSGQEGGRATAATSLPRIGNCSSNDTGITSAHSTTVSNRQNSSTTMQASHSQSREGPNSTSTLLPTGSGPYDRSVRTTSRSVSTNLLNGGPQAVATSPRTETVRNGDASRVRQSTEDQATRAESTSITSRESVVDSASAPGHLTFGQQRARQATLTRPVAAHHGNRAPPSGTTAASLNDAPFAGTSSSQRASAVTDIGTRTGCKPPVASSSNRPGNRLVTNPLSRSNQGSGLQPGANAPTVSPTTSTSSGRMPSNSHFVARQTTQIKPRATVRSRRAQPQAAGAGRNASPLTSSNKQRSRAATDHSRQAPTSSTSSATASSSQQMTSILQASGSLTASSETTRGNVTSRRRRSQPRQKDTEGRHESRPMSRPKRRSEIVEEIHSVIG